MVNKRIHKFKARFGLGLSVFISLLFVGTAISPVLALSQADYDAIYSNWPDWIADSGSCAAPGNPSTGTTSTGTSVPIVGGDNEQTAFDYFVSNGLTAVQASAIIGNLMQESGLNPNAVQAISNPARGMGIAQWSANDRWLGVVKLAASEGKSPTDLGVQLQFLLQELKSNYPTVYATLKSQTDVTLATEQFEQGYEAAGTPNMANRVKYAEQVLAQYGSSAGSIAPTTGGTAGCTTAGNITCASGDSSAVSSGADTSTLSATRQAIICDAEHELAVWQGQPGYPNATPYSKTGYLVYSQGRQEEWCADFVSWIYNQASYPLQPDPNWNIPSVAQIQALGILGTPKLYWHPESTHYIPKPGDIAIHGTFHTNIFISNSGGVSTYIGGDQGHGPYPGGSVVSTETGNGYYDNGITGYVSPD